MQRIRDGGERCTSKRLQVAQERETPIRQGKKQERRPKRAGGKITGAFSPEGRGGVREGFRRVSIRKISLVTLEKRPKDRKWETLPARWQERGI